MFGYFRVNDLDKTISCKLDTRDQKAEIDFSYAENVVVQNRFEMDSRVIVTMNRRGTMYDSLMDDFEGEGATFPGEHWERGATRIARSQRRPQRRRRRVEKGAVVVQRRRPRRLASQTPRS